MPALQKLYLACNCPFKSNWPDAPRYCCPSKELISSFEAEGITLLSSSFDLTKAQVVVEVSEVVAPRFLMQRLKGRWSRVLGVASADFPGFEKAYLTRTIGQNTRSIVEKYVQSQVDHSDLVDPLYRERMKELRFHQEETYVQKNRHRGIYDLFAHLVLVTGGRYRLFSAEARKVFDSLCSGVETLGAEVLDISMMPDHAHLLLRWPSELSGMELIEGVKRESGKLLRRTAFWSGGGYVGSVGPYRLKVAMEKNRRRGWVRAR
ncbi:MAG: transposase [Kiritimatiellae bacterium]|jgi:REP element-mobilizing transposase RayT|nr:transposase [Kiritimatiellia bacterium]